MSLNNTVIPRVSKLRRRHRAACVRHPALLSQRGVGVIRSAATHCAPVHLFSLLIILHVRLWPFTPPEGEALLFPTLFPTAHVLSGTHLHASPCSYGQVLLPGVEFLHHRVPAYLHLHSVLPTCRLRELHRVPLAPQGAQSPAPGTAQAREAEERGQHSIPPSDWARLSSTFHSTAPRDSH